jgi:glucokinase
LHYLDHNIEYYASGNLFSSCFNTTAEAAHQLALQGDESAKESWRVFGSHLAEAIKSVVFTYDPEAIVLGGSLSKAFNLFAEAMMASLRDFPYPKSIAKLQIYQSKNPDISLLGAAALCGRETGTIR